MKYSGLGINSIPFLILLFAFPISTGWIFPANWNTHCYITTGTCWQELSSRRGIVWRVEGLFIQGLGHLWFSMLFSVFMNLFWNLIWICVWFNVIILYPIPMQSSLTTFSFIVDYCWNVCRINPGWLSLFQFIVSFWAEETFNIWFFPLNNRYVFLISNTLVMVLV